MRASYRRLKGTEQFLGFYDVHADCLSGLFRRRKRVLDISKAFCYLRHCHPRKRLFVILDNPQFGVLKRFTLANTDDPTHVARRRRIYAYLRYRRKLANLRHPLNRIRSFRYIKLERH